MQQSIRFKGLSLTPDEMAVENGALSLCGNLELHDGALRPSFVSGTMLANPLRKTQKLLYVHETGDYRHFITVGYNAVVVSGSHIRMAQIYWYKEDGSVGKSLPIHYFEYSYSGFKINSVSSVGNTLVIITTNGVHYFLWKDDDYKYLGEKPPFIDLSFSVNSSNMPEDYSLGGITGEGSTAGFNEAFQQTIHSCGDTFNSVGSTFILDTSRGHNVMNIKEDKQSDITQSVYALLNRTNNLIARHGRFYANFFVRYCYRMFDGSMIMHSAPVFIPVMVPDNYLVSASNIEVNYGTNSDGKETFSISCLDEITFNRKDVDGNNKAVGISKVTFHYKPRNTALYYTLRGDISELKKWNDIIKSIDIFITPPITKIDTSEKISTLVYAKNEYTFGVRVSPSTWGVNSSSFLAAHQIGWAVVDFPSLSDDTYRNKLKNSSAYYKACSLKVSELTELTSRTELPIDKSVVYQTSLQEQMKDDYKTHNYLFANGGYVYNHRLNLYGVKEKLFAGFNRRSMFPNADDFFWDMTKMHITKIVTVLNTSSGMKYVENTNDQGERLTASMLANACKFYPDSRAEKMVFFCSMDSDSTEVIYAFDLEACEEMNGAIHMGTFENDGGTPDDYKVSSFDYTVDDMVEMQNKIYTSESDNAFYFPLNGINTVGIGSIQGIASTTRALSQGQFGQYPLMAFSTDGIWALNVSSSGTYSNIQPISREVCSNPKSITQLDQSVAFATNRSFSRVAESQVVSMSDCLDGPGFDIVNNLGKFFNFFNDLEDDTEETKAVKVQMRQLIKFTSSPIDFFQNCQVVYDYKNSRLFCLKASDSTTYGYYNTVALCYSMKDDAWSTFIIKDFLTAVNSYPSPYVQFQDGSVMTLDKGYDYSDDTEYHGIIVTRTLKFDEDCAPDAITGYIHSLTTGTVPVMWIYGSNDNQHWHYAGRVGGMKSNYMASHSYRFFRIALYLKMKSRQQYFATRLEVIRRFNKF